MSLLVGLTGSMGSGKTLTANFFQALGAYVIDADAICRNLVEPGKPALKEIVECFGKEILLANGILNRLKMAKIVFADSAKKKALENILHPKVFEEEQRVYKNIQAAQKNTLVIIDAPLLIESGNYKKMDKVLVVICDKEKQVQRLEKLGSWNRKEIEKRILNQMKAEKKTKYADYVIHNDGTIDDLRVQVASVFNELSNFV